LHLVVVVVGKICCASVVCLF